MKIWIKSFNGGEGVLALLDPTHIRLKIQNNLITIKLPHPYTAQEIDNRLTKKGYKRLQTQ
jgi:hypothetical protein